MVIANTDTTMMTTPRIELQSLVDTLENPAIVIDRRHRIVAANKSYCRSYGLAPEAVISRYCYEISHGLTTPCHHQGEDCPYLRVFSQRESAEVLHTHYDGQGGKDYVRIRAYPLQDESGEVYMLESIQRIAPTSQAHGIMNMVGHSKAFVSCIEQLTAAAGSGAPVLITGESGVGKEHAAHYIYSRSKRCSGPFIVLNCAAIPESICESELFGHEKGAFTGCSSARKGLYEMADGGTLFLDEIGELPLSIQAKVLRVLDRGEFWRVGGRNAQHADVRIVAATNRDLAQMVADGRFREDLYYRIAALTTNIPPLRERRKDIPTLVDFFLRRYGTDHGQPPRITREAQAALVDYDYPGNIRELGNIIQRALAVAHDGVIYVGNLGLNTGRARIHAACQAIPALPTAPIQTVEGATPTIREMEREYMLRLLREHGGNKQRVATILGISVRTLYRRMDDYRLDTRGPDPWDGRSPPG